jgi:hypothetical protein
MRSRNSGLGDCGLAGFLDAGFEVDRSILDAWIISSKANFKHTEEDVFPDSPSMCQM